jgi:hypothetical protein
VSGGAVELLLQRCWQVAAVTAIVPYSAARGMPCCMMQLRVHQAS